MYVAPEILSTHGRGSYTNKVDVWSLGVILYTCLSALTPFSNSNQQVSLYEQITQGSYDFPANRFSKVDERAKDLVRRKTVEFKYKLTNFTHFNKNFLFKNISGNKTFLFDNTFNFCTHTFLFSNIIF